MLADRLGTTVEEKKFKGCYGRGIIGGQKVLLLKPQTFMNLSGESVRAAADFYKVDPEHIIIVYDDISLDVGQLRIRKKAAQEAITGLKISFPIWGPRSSRALRWEWATNLRKWIWLTMY